MRVACTSSNVTARCRSPKAVDLHFTPDSRNILVFSSNRSRMFWTHSWWLPPLSDTSFLLHSWTILALLTWQSPFSECCSVVVHLFVLFCCDLSVCCSVVVHLCMLFSCGSSLHVVLLCNCGSFLCVVLLWITTCGSSQRVVLIFTNQTDLGGCQKLPDVLNGIFRPSQDFHQNPPQRRSQKLPPIMTQPAFSDHKTYGPTPGY